VRIRAREMVREERRGGVKGGGGKWGIFEEREREREQVCALEGYR